MALNDQKICVQIAKKPGCRAVDLADLLNCELIEISNALRALVEVGDVVRTGGTGANGQPAQFYTLSDAFLKSREGKLIVAQMEAEKSPTPTPIPTPAPLAEADSSSPPLQAESAPTTPPSPLQAENAVTAMGANRVDLAISFIREHGTVSDAQLRTVMGLRAGQYPAAWLTYAVRDGRVRKNGKEWSLGDGTQQHDTRLTPANCAPPQTVHPRNWCTPPPQLVHP